MQAIEVTAYFDENGKVMPISFTWNGSRYQIESVGRHWHTEEGQHILVMVPGGRIFELLFVCNESRWFLGRAETSHLVA